MRAIATITAATCSRQLQEIVSSTGPIYILIRRQDVGLPSTRLLAPHQKIWKIRTQLLRWPRPAESVYTHLSGRARYLYYVTLKLRTFSTSQPIDLSLPRHFV